MKVKGELILNCSMIKRYLIFIVIAVAGSVIVNRIASKVDLVFALVVIFLLVLGYNILKEVYNYIKVRNGVFAVGKLESFRKLASDEKGNSNYELTIEFLNPLDNKQYAERFYLFLFNKPDANKQYKVWINKKRANSFLLFEKFNLPWALILIGGGLVWAYLLYYLLSHYTR